MGTYPKVVVVPQNINEDFLLLIEKLESEMTLTKFRAATKLDLSPQLKALIQQDVFIHSFLAKNLILCT